MESSPRAQDRGYNPNPNPNPNPNLNTLPSPTTSSSSSSCNNGVFRHNHHSLSSPKLHLQQNPQPIMRSEPNPNPYPTTFVQADTSSFKQVVQMLTGSSKPANPNPIPPIKTTSKSKPSKLYERRNSLKNNLRIINPSGFGSGSGFSPRNINNPEILSPSFLDFPALTLSPVTPLIPDLFNRSPAPPVVDTAAEEKAIAEKGFFLHPSPASTPRDSEPRLLPLFPETSPRIVDLCSALAAFELNCASTVTALAKRKTQEREAGEGKVGA
ncbi:hypothetical protein Cgig2_028887 [Carnegiea gigantea]|uniref:VQ domain-containing protein n=1 Tax=Carnegiea gigantea TaxID=171969 RepID=A0A9Q1KSI4_9CARY|nr:hypothetical protein Cgig2_028887 [Carnegiea gigantea]